MEPKLISSGDVAIDVNNIRYADLNATINGEPGVAIYWKDTDPEEPTTFVGSKAGDVSAIVLSAAVKSA